MSHLAVKFYFNFKAHVCVCICSGYMHIGVGILGCHKRALESLELELQAADCKLLYVGDGNQF